MLYGIILFILSRMFKRTDELKAELSRKSIHMLIALVPVLAAMSRSHTALLLMGGTLLYAWAEGMRFLGFNPPLISCITARVLRRREEGRFAFAPVTLGLGALLPLLLFPPKAAAAAIYALAFGDSASTMVGKFLGRLRPAFLSGKSIEGSLACFAASTLACFLVFHDWKTAVIVGVVSVAVDAVPLKEFDNLLIPLAAGFTAALL